MTTFDIAEFKQAVERHWRYHAPCETLLWNVQEADDGWQIEVAPAFQEVVGGEQDGMKVWAGFRFDVSAFLAERGVLVETVLAASYCVECAETPHFLITGSYFGESFRLKLHLEPIPNSEPMEIIDMLKHRVRNITEKQP
jgi:hypothetical protein